MNKEFFLALDMLEKEKGIPKEYMLEKIEAALLSACKKEYGSSTVVRVAVDPVKEDLKVYVQKEVVEEVTNPQCQISLEDAKAISRRYTLGKIVETEVKTKNVRRLSASAAKSVIIQGIREGVQKNDGLMYGLGATLTPVKALTFRAYYGLNEGSDAKQENIQNLATFVGLKLDWFSLGAEYNRIWNAKHTDGSDFNGFSIYGNATLNKQVNAYLRYDDCSDGKQAFIAGVQWKLGKYVKVSPNFRWNHADVDGGNQDSYMGYISCYFGF